jgi:hypothetical protein
VDAALQKTLAQTLNIWKQSDLIAYEWIQQVNIVDEFLLNKINRTAYSYILVIGNELVPTALTAATKALDKRWILLPDALNLKANAETLPDNVALYSIDPSFLSAQWDEWVKRQNDAKQSIQWITRLSEPIPVNWAPSEEADHIMQIDLLQDAWFTQLEFQVKNIQAKWIVLYTSLEPASLQKIKSLNIPIVDMKENNAMVWNWEAVMAEQLKFIQVNGFQKGIHHYNSQQTKLNH